MNKMMHAEVMDGLLNMTNGINRQNFKEKGLALLKTALQLWDTGIITFEDFNTVVDHLHGKEFA